MILITCVRLLAVITFLQSMLLTGQIGFLNFRFLERNRKLNLESFSRSSKDCLFPFLSYFIKIIEELLIHHATMFSDSENSGLNISIKIKRKKFQPEDATNYKSSNILYQQVKSLNLKATSKINRILESIKIIKAVLFRPGKR